VALSADILDCVARIESELLERAATGLNLFVDAFLASFGRRSIRK